MAYNTGNPVEPNGSRDPRDLRDNAQIIDKLANSSDLTWLGRLGKTLKTWAGMTAEHEASQAQRTVEFQQFLQNSGYEVPVAYAAGISITRATQTVLYNGEIYRPVPSALPFVTTTFPADSAKWVSNGDNSLRQDLSSPAGASKIGFDQGLSYPASTIGAAVASVTRPGAGKNQDGYIGFDMLSNLGDLTTFNAAVRTGTVRVALTADSIGEGDRDGVYENSTFAILMRTLRQQNPGVTFVFANFALAGRGIATYFDPNYKGIPGPNDNPATGFYRPPGNQFTAQWPGGSVVGKSWADHVKDFAPDLVIYMHGANDLSGQGTLGAAQYKAALNYQSTWDKKPSTAIATAALPAVSAGYQLEVQVAANTARGIARELKLTLIDVNRMFLLLRQAIDIDYMAYLRDDGFVGYPSGWTPDAGSTLSLVDSSGFAIQGTGGAMRNTQSADCNVAANFAMSDWSSQTGEIWYRSLGSLASRYTAQVTSGSLFLYWGTTIIGSTPIASIPNNAQVSMQAVVQGNQHRVYVNGALALTVFDYNNLMSGAHGVRITGGNGIISALVVHTGNPLKVGTPKMTDADFYGKNDFGTNPSSEGGNGINHPTILGNRVCWAASFAGLEHHTRSLPLGIVSVVAPFRAQGNEAFDQAGATLQTSIDGTLVGTPTGILATSTGACANKYDCRQVVGGRSVVVQVILSTGPTALLKIDVVLPAGTWLLTAASQFTKDSAGVYRNALTVTGVRAS
ncbi:SGNH/GDSL hydrolase family protein [Pseudomonas tolaasii]|uniref:SGNH/GDSL hydrolase family protein n=1 Tax=Pseudomonas tolaasii TaxID=29442 RepID=UPI0015BD5938|nr:SGNH/GDSL hydrolase family protein [Pseudomonas tolaasii]NWE66642.1 SGNH/GDSL hydrolase family protein [Pseudomonas tolaasii]